MKPCLLVIDDEPDLVQSVQDLSSPRVPGSWRHACCPRARADRPGTGPHRHERSTHAGDERRRISLPGQETHPDTVRLLFTAYSDLAAVIDAINEGNVYRYISKPWEVDELRATLKQAYEHYQLQEERRELSVQVQTERRPARGRECRIAPRQRSEEGVHQGRQP